MARTNATNFTQIGLQFPYANAATDPFRKEDVQVLAVAVDQHDHADTRGLAVTRVAAGSIDASAIADGSITSIKIADGTVSTTDLADSAVVTAKLAANAVTQVTSVHGSTSNPSMSSPTFVDMPEMVITINTLTGTAVLLLFAGALSGTTVGSVIAVAFGVDAIDNQFASDQIIIANAGLQVAGSRLVTGLSAGSHTFKARWLVNSGSASAIGVVRELQAIEFRR
jgi:hypothetical protein